MFSSFYVSTFYKSQNHKSDIDHDLNLMKIEKPYRCDIFKLLARLQVNMDK